MGHSSVERRLRTDIEERHRLRNKLRKKRSLAVRLTRELELSKKKRLNNRYSVTVKRLDAEIEALEHRLNGMNLDLQKRIMDEMKFSEEEIKNFTDQYQKEYTEILETESKLKAIEEGTLESDDEETSEEESVSKEALVARTKRMLDRERKILDGIQKEIGSEERDKILFTKELQQITTELETYRENQMQDSVLDSPTH